MRLGRNILLVLLSVALMIGATAASGEEFYATRLREGFTALAAGETPRAAESCRIAAFGLMGQPPQLTSAVVCLALAASASERPDDVSASLQRFLEIESRFRSYASAPLADPFRRSFDALLLSAVGAERLATIPSLASIGGVQPTPATEPAVAEVTPERVPERTTAARVAQPVAEPDEPTVTERVSVPDPVAAAVAETNAEITQPPAAVAEPAAEPSTPAERSTTVDAGPPADLAPVEPADPFVAQSPNDPEADRVLAEARRLIATERAADAARLVYRQLAKTPSRRDLRLTLLEAATLNKDWRTAASQTNLLQPFVQGEEFSMFYAAVALFESDRKSDARRMLERSLDSLPDTEYVKYYTRRIIAMQ